MYKHLIIILTITLIMSCGKKTPGTISEYKQWFLSEENGYIKIQNINGLNFRVLYKTKECMAINEIVAENHLSKEAIDSLINSYGKNEYFVFEVSMEDDNTDAFRNNSDDFADYKLKMNYLSFNMQDAISLVAGDDTIKTSVYHYEKDYELEGKQNILFAFPYDVTGKQDVTFIYDDKLFNAGKLKFKFNIDKNNIPELPINKI